MPPIIPYARRGHVLRWRPILPKARRAPLANLRARYSPTPAIVAIGPILRENRRDPGASSGPRRRATRPTCGNASRGPRPAPTSAPIIACVPFSTHAKSHRRSTGFGLAASNSRLRPSPSVRHSPTLPSTGLSAFQRHDRALCSRRGGVVGPRAPRSGPAAHCLVYHRSRGNCVARRVRQGLILWLVQSGSRRQAVLLQAVAGSGRSGAMSSASC